jgi:hypothetical protein
LAGSQSARKKQALFPEEPDRFDRAAGSLEGLEHQTDSVLHLRVRIETDRSVAPIDQADGRPHFEFTSARLIELPAAHARLEYMQLRLAHRPL